MTSESPARDRLRAFFAEPTARRLLLLAIFLGSLVAFHSLLPLLVFFVAFERMFGALAGFLHRRAHIRPKLALAAVALVILGVVGGSMALGVGRSVRAIRTAKDTLPAKIAAIRDSELFKEAQEHLEDAADKIVAGAEHYAKSALHLLGVFGHILLFALIGFIIAIVYRLERHELDQFGKRIAPGSYFGILLRWYSHVADALVVMVQFQLVVAACNAALTLPVLFLLRLPHIPSLLALIFVSGLVPVVGNLVSGAILSLLAYQAHGPGGVALFIGLTFVLHKLESYYLNPRLAARHVKLPGFVLICSLILFEHVFGFAGLFLSFPTLFVAQRIHAELFPKAPPAESPSLTAAEPDKLTPPPPTAPTPA